MACNQFSCQLSRPPLLPPILQQWSTQWVEPIHQLYSLVISRVFVPPPFCLPFVNERCVEEYRATYGAYKPWFLRKGTTGCFPLASALDRNFHTCPHLTKLKLVDVNTPRPLKSLATHIRRRLITHPLAHDNVVFRSSALDLTLGSLTYLVR